MFARFPVLAQPFSATLNSSPSGRLWLKAMYGELVSIIVCFLCSLGKAALVSNSGCCRASFCCVQAPAHESTLPHPEKFSLRIQDKKKQGCSLIKYIMSGPPCHSMWHPRQVSDEADRLWPREPTIKWVMLAKHRWPWDVEVGKPRQVQDEGLLCLWRAA